jgi:hypothetical protein
MIGGIVDAESTQKPLVRLRDLSRLSPNRLFSMSNSDHAIAGQSDFVRESLQRPTIAAPIPA